MITIAIEEDMENFFTLFFEKSISVVKQKTCEQGNKHRKFDYVCLMYILKVSLSTQL